MITAILSLIIPHDVFSFFCFFVLYSEPKCRPTFQELIERFKDLQRQHAVQSHMQRVGETTQTTAKASFQDRNEPD